MGLTSLVVATVLLLGVRLGYPPVSLAVLCLAGVGAALGVRNAATTDRLAVVGVLPLWLAALVFTGVTASLLGSAPSPTHVTVAIAAGALLGPFGVVGNTVRTYGEGTGRTLLGRYLTGTLVLAGLVAVYGLLLATLSAGLSNLGGSVGGGLGSLLPEELAARVLYGVVLYPAVLLLVSAASDRFPAEVFVPFDDLDRVEQVRSRVDAVVRGGWQVLGGLGLVLAVGVGARVLRDPGDSSEGAAETVETVTLGIVGVATARPLLGLAVVSCALLGLVVLSLYVLREHGTASATVLTQTVGPPLALVVGVVALTTVFAGQIPMNQLSAVVEGILADGSSLSDLLTTYPSLLVLVLSTLAILVSAVVFSVPTTLAAGPAIDDSLAGLGAGVLALLLFVLAAVLGGEPGLVIVAGVAVIAVVWELGEYATVAAGELRTPSRGSGLPPDFGSLTSIHAVASLAVAAVGVLLAGGIAAIAGAATLPNSFALLAVIASALGLAGLVLLLTG